MTVLLLGGCLFLLGITFANVVGWPAPARRGEAPSRSVAVLIPARNEAAQLPACLESILGQGDCVAEILVYDDHSTDETPQIVDAMAKQDSRLRLLAPLPLPDGWTGKNFACAQLAAAATAPTLLFLDADARLLPGAIDRLQSEMVRRRLQFLSCWPGLVLHSFWERTLMPMLNLVVFSIYPAPLSFIFGYVSLALAHGACLMIDRESYFALGGHSAVRDQIFEDTRLAQLWRRRGRRGLCLDGQSIVRVRMYDSLTGIWGGFQKNFYPAFESPISFWVFLVVHTVFFLSPFVWLIFFPTEVALQGAAMAVLGIRGLLALRFRQPLWSVLLHPIAEGMLLALGLHSWWRCRTGRGVEWKGRHYLERSGGAGAGREPGQR
jgi:chlorobactene glucosyltransferase